MSSLAKTPAAPGNKVALATQTRPAGGVLQRRCACGNHTTAAGECAECAQKHNVLQRRLAIGASNDPSEREADRLAEQVVMEQANSEIISAPLGIQRYAAPATVETTMSDSVDAALHASGRPLDADTRAFFEARFAHDFSGVRVHDDAQAALSAQSVNALAYTVGSDVVFGAGQYRPYQAEGRKLLAHELVHTVQQQGRPLRQAAGNTMRHAPTISVGGPMLSRQTKPDAKQTIEDLNRVPGPSAKGPDQAEQDAFADADSKPKGREKIAAPSTWGWGAPETNNQYQECTVAEMPRERFLAFEATLPKAPPQPRRKTPNDGPKHPLGATWPDMQAAVAPEIVAEMVQEDGRTLYRIKPTHAEMPPVKSAYTQAGTFQEGIVSFMAYEAGGSRICPNLAGRAPQFWQITEEGAKKIWAGEMEHCSDIRAAFDATLVIYASAINNEAAAERRYRSANQTVAETKQRLASIPLDPVDMVNACGQEIEKTRLRDTRHWHDGIVSVTKKPQENACKGFLGIFDEQSFPEVGDGPQREKHPTREVMEGQVGNVGQKP